MARLGRSQPQSTRVLRPTPAAAGGTTYTLDLSCSTTASAALTRAPALTKAVTATAAATRVLSVAATRAITATTTATLVNAAKLILSVSATGAVSWYQTAAVGRGGATTANPPITPGSSTYPGTSYPSETVGATVLVTVDRGGATAAGRAMQQSVTLSATATSSVSLARAVSRTLAATSTSAISRVLSASRALSASTSSSPSVTLTDVAVVDRGGATTGSANAAAAVSVDRGGALARDPFANPSDTTYPGVFPGEIAYVGVATVGRGGATASGHEPFVGTAITLSASASSSATLSRAVSRVFTATASSVLVALKAVARQLLATTTAQATVSQTEGEEVGRGEATASGTEASAVVGVGTGGALAANPFGYPSDSTYPGIYPGESGLIVAVVADRGAATAAGTVPGAAEAKTLSASTTPAATVKKTVAITLSVNVGAAPLCDAYVPETAGRGGATAVGLPLGAVVFSGRGSALTGSYTAIELVDAGSGSWFLAVVSDDLEFEAVDVGSDMTLEAV